MVQVDNEDFKRLVELLNKLQCNELGKTANFQVDEAVEIISKYEVK